MWDKYFQVRALTMAINNMKTAPTKILDKLFGRKQGKLSDVFAWDIKTNSETLMKSIKTHEPATVETKTDRKTITCVAPRFAEKRMIHAFEINNMRAFGDEAAVQLLQEKIGDEQFDMRQKVDRTREFMAAKALSGTILTFDGDTLAPLVSFAFPAEHTPTLTGANLFTDAASDPLMTIRAWKKLIGQKVGGVTRWDAFVGTSVADALLKHAKTLEFLKYTAGRDIAESGFIGRLAGVDMEEYWGSYTDKDGTRHDLVPEDRFILVGSAPDCFGELYAPAVNLQSQGGVGTRVAPNLFYSDSKDEWDPSGKWLRVESRPLPVVYKPECIVYAKVV